MEKMRSEKQFINESLYQKFKWINSVKRVNNFIPSSSETYVITFNEIFTNFEYKYDSKLSEKDKFEKFVFDFFEISNGGYQVIVCWKETEVIVIVFYTRKYR